MGDGAVVECPQCGGTQFSPVSRLTVSSQGLVRVPQAQEETGRFKCANCSAVIETDAEGCLKLVNPR